MVHRVALLFGHVHEVAHIPQVDLLVVLVPVFLALVGRKKKDASCIKTSIKDFGF